MKSTSVFICCFLFGLSCLCHGASSDDVLSDGADYSSVRNQINSVQLAKKMGVGWNLGNSLEAIGGETNWGNPRVTQTLIDSVKAAGFKTIRLPVAWSQFSDEQNFVIKAQWMKRIDEVVNYALKSDMYVLLNMHWDGGWMQPTAAKQAYVNNRLAIMWQQIAAHFKGYDHRLLFAGTNEVMVDHDYSTPTPEYYGVQNSFNQTFVDTVRATGGENATRFLVVQGFNTNIDHTVNFAKIPRDTVENRLLMEVHYYDPYNFTLNNKSKITQWGKLATGSNAVESWADEKFADAQFQKMKTRFVDQGVGVILGEYGAIARPDIKGHNVFRTYWTGYITESAIKHQLVPVYWDNGYAGVNGTGIFNRRTGAQVDPDIVNAIVKTLR